MRPARNWHHWNGTFDTAGNGFALREINRAIFVWHQRDRTSLMDCSLPAWATGCSVNRAPIALHSILVDTTP